MCIRCADETTVREAREAMLSIYQEEGRNSGPVKKVTREQIADALKELGTVAAVAKKFGVTVQSIYRTRRINLKKTQAWYLQGAEGD